MRVDEVVTAGVAAVAAVVIRVTSWTEGAIMGDEGSADRPVARRGVLSRAVDRVAEWLLPDPTAELDRAWRAYREQGKQDPGQKPS